VTAAVGTALPFPLPGRPRARPADHLTPAGPFGATVVLRRLARARRPRVTTESHPDDLPKRGLFAEPVRITRLTALEPDEDEEGVARAVFLVEVKDAEDRRCSDIAVEARVTGPERSRTVQGTTDMMGRIRFRMASGPGHYQLQVTDVAARGLDWDATAGPKEISVDLP
jgi:hypothetical protein